MEGPHCPKCGHHDRWEYYSGPEENPDALRCETIKITAGISDQCGYIYWRRNAPAGTVNDVDRSNAEQIAAWKVKDRRARVRKLVFAILASPRLTYGPNGEQGYIEVAVAIDDMIEKIGAARNEP
jgi:hypothetical protein